MDAFSSLTAARLPELYRTARLIVRDADATADAVQEALIGAWRDLPSLREVTSFDAWLRRLLVRACVRASKKGRSHSIIEIPISPTIVASTPDTERALAVRDQLERGFRRLPDEQRTVVVLRHFVGLSLVETAEAMGVPIGTVQSRHNRALQGLRAALDADERTSVHPLEAVR
ncbi:MAG: RNA polymerase sigma factor [Chloroflexi bacterium]|nr:RNA polymerase sigma factor [Chloroflexota bacterium]